MPKKTIEELADEAAEDVTKISQSASKLFEAGSWLENPGKNVSYSETRALDQNILNGETLLRDTIVTVSSDSPINEGILRK